MIELNNKERVSDGRINYFYGTVTYCSDESINYRPDIEDGPTPRSDKIRSVFISLDDLRRRQVSYRRLHHPNVGEPRDIR